MRILLYIKRGKILSGVVCVVHTYTQRIKDTTLLKKFFNNNRSSDDHERWRGRTSKTTSKLVAAKIKAPSKFTLDVISSSLNAQNIYNVVLSGSGHERPEALSDIVFVLRFATCNRKKSN